ncbi:MAG: hypothetical protein OEW62_04070 [Candidatus Bathyarchaeota archaeon]|nr:hypothetical protein [Candidatus Bathyarchaeota archaeon]MDH5745480.1 hypothetical protein [Candidatus Bathyarchaeota archaeon]
MPHVVLNGDVELRDVFDKMKPLIIRDEHVILRTLKKYIDWEEKSILTEALVIEKGRKTDFLALLGSREDALVVRIYPGSSVEKTDGVKRLLAEIARQLLDTFPNLKVGKTNLQDFLWKKS